MCGQVIYSLVGIAKRKGRHKHNKVSNATTEFGRQEQEKVHVLGAKVAKEHGSVVEGKQDKAGREGV